MEEVTNLNHFTITAVMISRNHVSFSNSDAHISRLAGMATSVRGAWKRIPCVLSLDCIICYVSLFNFIKLEWPDVSSWSQDFFSG